MLLLPKCSNFSFAAAAADEAILFILKFVTEFINYFCIAILKKRLASVFELISRSL
jgi:hypothetical protein